MDCLPVTVVEPSGVVRSYTYSPSMNHAKLVRSAPSKFVFRLNPFNDEARKLWFARKNIFTFNS